jgi:hypothetical protein
MPQPHNAVGIKKLHFWRKREKHTMPSKLASRTLATTRPMATTRSWDSNQRLVNVPFKLRGLCCLQAVIPSEQDLDPPGWYITDRHGIPSVAKWVHLMPKDGLTPVPISRSPKVSETSPKACPDCGRKRRSPISEKSKNSEKGSEDPKQW